MADLFHFMESGRLVVPSFQRAYVWTKEAARQLFVSVNRGYPIGVIIAAEHAAEYFNASPSDMSLFPTPRGQARESARRLWLIDGSQRMAALYNGCFGLHESFVLLYELRRREFLFPEQALQSAPLLKMSSLFNAKELMSLQARLASTRGGESLLTELNGIRDRFYSYSVPMLIVEDFEDSEIVDIFTRMNSSGVSLTKKELAHARRYTSRKD